MSNTSLALAGRAAGIEANPESTFEPKRLVNTKVAAKLTGVHPVSLCVWRCAEPPKGPPFRRLPGTDRIVYDTYELRDWCDKGKVEPQVTYARRTLDRRSQTLNLKRHNIESIRTNVSITRDELHEDVKQAVREAKRNVIAGGVKPSTKPSRSKAVAHIPPNALDGRHGQ